MTWLKKIGEIILRAGQLVVGFGPGLASLTANKTDDKLVGVFVSEFTQVAQIIAQVEVFGQALGTAGPDKLKAAAPAVAQIVLASSLMVKHEIANPVLFQQGCTKLADGMADILNSLKPNVEVTNKLS
jgi:hypothetical protein